MKCSESGDSIELFAELGENETPPEKLQMKFANKVIYSTFVQKTVHDEHDPLEIPEKEYTCSLSMPSAEFRRICKDLSIISASIAIDFAPDRVTFSAGEQGNEGQIVLKENFEFDEKNSVK